MMHNMLYNVVFRTGSETAICFNGNTNKLLPFVNIGGKLCQLITIGKNDISWIKFKSHETKFKNRNSRPEITFINLKGKLHATFANMIFSDAPSSGYNASMYRSHSHMFSKTNNLHFYPEQVNDTIEYMVRDICTNFKLFSHLMDGETFSKTNGMIERLGRDYLEADINFTNLVLGPVKIFPTGGDGVLVYAPGNFKLRRVYDNSKELKESDLMLAIKSQGLFTLRNGSIINLTEKQPLESCRKHHSSGIGRFDVKYSIKRDRNKDLLNRGLEAGRGAAFCITEYKDSYCKAKLNLMNVCDTPLFLRKMHLDNFYVLSRPGNGYSYGIYYPELKVTLMGFTANGVGEQLTESQLNNFVKLLADEATFNKTLVDFITYKISHTSRKIKGRVPKLTLNNL